MTGKRSRVHPWFKTKYAVRNRPAYDRALVRRGAVVDRRGRILALVQTAELS